MKITIEIDDTHPNLALVLAALTAKVSAKVEVRTSEADIAAAVAKGKTTAEPVEIRHAKAEPAPVENKPAVVETPKSEPEEAKGEVKVDLAILQSLAASLLAAGERRTLKSILDENDVKSLSTADEEAYPALFDALTGAVSALN